MQIQHDINESRSVLDTMIVNTNVTSKKCPTNGVRSLNAFETREYLVHGGREPGPGGL
jgi:hypothetical protein